MPSYDMSCTVCGARFEVFRQRFLDEADRVCIECGERAESLLTGFVTSRPARDATAPKVRTAAHGGGCSCCSGAHPSSRAEWQTGK